MAYNNNYNSYNNGNNGGDFQQVHVNSSTLMMFSGDSCLRISLYDQTLSLAFIPAVTDPNTGKRRFPKENALNALLTAERVTALYSIMKHRTQTALEEHHGRSDAITCNRDGTTMLCVEVTPENQVNLTLHTEIGEDRIPKRSMTFTFQEIIPIMNYNPTTGEFTAGDAPIHAQMKLFMMMLEGFCYATIGAEHHFGKYSDRFSDRRMMGAIGAMANSLGVTAPNAPNYNNAIPGTSVAPGGAFNPNNGTGTNGVPVDNVSNLNDMFNNDGDLPF